MDDQELISLIVEMYMEYQIQVRPAQRKSATGKLVSVSGYQKSGQPAQKKQPSTRGKKPQEQPQQRTPELEPNVPMIGDLFREFKNKETPKVVPIGAQAMYREYVSNMAIIRELIKETRNIDAARKDPRYKKLVQTQATLLGQFFKMIEDANRKGEQVAKKS